MTPPTKTAPALTPTLPPVPSVLEPAATWEDITPEIARELLAFNAANRGLRARVVNAYARDMANGDWLTTGETIKISTEGELLDGQHRLSAIVNTGITLRLLVVRNLHPDTRAVIDTGAPRTGGDALRMAGVVSHNVYALASAARLLLLWEQGALPTMTAGMRHQDRVTHAELLHIVQRTPDLIDAVADAHRDYERIGMPVGAGAALRVILSEIDAKDAAVFFDALAGYATDGPNDPRAVLLYTLRQLRALGQLRKPGEVIGLTITAWNAWRDGLKITSLSTRDKAGKALKMPTPV